MATESDTVLAKYFPIVPEDNSEIRYASTNFEKIPEPRRTARKGAQQHVEKILAGRLPLAKLLEGTAADQASCSRFDVDKSGVAFYGPEVHRKL